MKAQSHLILADMNSLPFSKSSETSGSVHRASTPGGLLAIATTALSVGLLLCGVVRAQQPFAATVMPELGKVPVYQAKAEKGNPAAQTLLGLCYHQGLGVKQSDIEAVNWFRKAARQGLAPAQYNLGASYFNGLGVVGGCMYFNLAAASVNRFPEAGSVRNGIESRMTAGQIAEARRLVQE